MQELAERFLSDALSAWGLDIEYGHGAGDRLYRTSDTARQAPVLDFVGGFGSLFFGHNNPELVAYAKQLLDYGTPSHAQLSKRAEAQRVAAALNTIIERELQPGEPYAAIFANSGAEAVEAAMKHAELARVFRLGALAAELGAHSAEVATALAAGRATLSPAAAELGDARGIAAEVERRNAEAMGRPPEFFALEGGFHGKLVGSLQLTHNPGFRLPFQALGARARFAAVDRTEDLLKYVEAEQPYALDLVLTGGVVDVVRRPVPFVAGFIVEPIQGEGGINVLTPEQAERITEVCRTIGCPLIVDEIQTGAGRTGSFFAGAPIGLVGDYYTLAKSIGGGLAKTSILLIRQSLYVKEFELLHSSTYAKDSFSCSITERVLEMLERDDGAAYRRAAERGERLHAALEAVRADFPDQVASVRGRGLLAGFEFADQSGASSPVIRNYSLGGFFGFAVSGFLLRKHNLRLMPTGSAPHTLRIQPSSGLDDAGIAALAAGLREVCEVLRRQDAAHFVDALAGLGIRELRRPVPAAPAGPPRLRVGYVAALGEPAALREFDPALAVLDDETLASFVTRQSPVKAMVPLPAVRWGADVDVVVLPLLIAPGTPACAVAVDVAMQSGAAVAAGCDLVVVDPRLTGDAPAAVDGPAGFAMPAGFGPGVPAGLAAAIG